VCVISSVSSSNVIKIQTNDVSYGTIRETGNDYSIVNLMHLIKISIYQEK